MQLAPATFNMTPMALTDVACKAQTKPKDRVKQPAQDCPGGVVGTKDKIRAITVHFSTNFSQYSRCLNSCTSAYLIRIDQEAVHNKARGITAGNW